MNTIKSSEQISELFNDGRRYSSGEVRIIVKKTDDQRDQGGRVAFITGKRLGNAVVRNRDKRVMRECARKNGLPAEGYDILVMATPRTFTAPYAEVDGALGRLLSRAGVA